MDLTSVVTQLTALLFEFIKLCITGLLIALITQAAHSVGLWLLTQRARLREAVGENTAKLIEDLVVTGAKAAEQMFKNQIDAGSQKLAAATEFVLAALRERTKGGVDIDPVYLRGLIERAVADGLQKGLDGQAEG